MSSTNTSSWAGCRENQSRAARIERLARGEAVAVVTGQQVGLFGGPLYGIYKAATACALAEQLTRETGVEAVPVFWLQTEDADFAEIAGCEVLAASGDSVRLSVAPDGPDRVSVHHRRLGAGVSAALAALAEQLGSLPAAAEVVAVLARHYRPEATWADAFAGTMAELTRGWGLVFLDPRDPELAPLAAPLFGALLTEARLFDALLEARVEELVAADIEPQVPHRPGATLLCLHPDGSSGPRYRLVARDDGRWVLAGDPELDRSYDESELARLLASDPWHFSTTALSRPLWQDTLLPTAIYVGGPGEIAYFAELPPLYRALSLAPPFIAPRARLRLVPAAARRLAEQLDLSLDAAARPIAENRAALAARTAGAGALSVAAGRARAALAELWEACEGQVSSLGAVDAGLGRAAARTAEQVEALIAKLKRRIAGALGRSDEVTDRRLAHFQALLAPHGAPQERIYGFAGFAALAGVVPFAEMVRAAVRAAPTAAQDVVA
jgi:bacillithiol biosynthesis cysteine-adding enzyme BshC